MFYFLLNKISKDDVNSLVMKIIPGTDDGFDNGNGD